MIEGFAKQQTEIDDGIGKSVLITNFGLDVLFNIFSTRNETI